MRCLGGAALAVYVIALSGVPIALADELQSAPPTLSTEEASFLKENEAAMAKMMSAMATKPSGDIDRDFVAMMTPHHQGAIDMALIELRYGRNEQLRRIAQEIIIEQMQEIEAMKLAIGQQVTGSAPASTQQAVPTRAAKHLLHSDMHPDMSATGIKKDK
jgi:hypothetical protein